jgi:hypothetical protein
VYCVAEVRLLPFVSDTSGMSPRLQAEEATYHRMLRSFLQTKHMYFSYTFDLTNGLQVQAGWAPEQLRSPIWRTADSRYFWNEAMLRPLIQESADAFILPCLLGNLAIESCQLRGRRFDLALISRKNKRRAGTRFNRRGVSRDGQAANFVSHAYS